MKKTELDSQTYNNLVRIEQQSAADRSRNIQNSNDTERALCGQLMLVSTVFLTVSVVVLGNSDTLEDLNNYGRGLIITTFLLVLLSISSGVKYYFECIAFYEKWARVHHEIYETFRDGMLGAAEVSAAVLNAKTAQLPETSSVTWLKRQILLLGLGAVSCLLLLFTFLYVGNANNTANDLQIHKNQIEMKRRHSPFENDR